MMDPFRLRVLMALTDALKTITVENGYQHDVADTVYRGRLVLTEEDGLPCLAINEPPKLPEADDDPNTATSAVTELTVLVQGFIEDERENPTDPAYRLLADVQKCLVAERTRDDGFDILGFGPRIAKMRIGQGVVRSPDAVVSDNSFFWLPVTLEFAEDLQNPFA